MALGRAGAAAPSRRVSAGSTIKRRNASASADTSPGGVSKPQVSSTISQAPPMPLVTTGRPARSASTSDKPNGSGDVFGWQNTSAARSTAGTSARSPNR